MNHEQQNLINRIEAAAEASGLSAATICERAVGNSRLYDRLTNGGSCTYKIGGKIHQFLDGLEGLEATQ